MKLDLTLNTPEELAFTFTELALMSFAAQARFPLNECEATTSALESALRKVPNDVSLKRRLTAAIKAQKSAYERWLMFTKALELKFNTVNLPTIPMSILNRSGKRSGKHRT